MTKRPGLSPPPRKPKRTPKVRIKRKGDGMMIHRIRREDEEDRHPDSEVKPPKCCGQPMAYSGHRGWYCLACGGGR